MSNTPSTPVRGYQADVIVPALVFAALLLGPAWGLYPVLGTTLLCMSIFAIGYHLLLGYANLASLGHAAFYGVAAYASGNLTKAYVIDASLALLLGLVIGGLLGAVMGYMAIRRKGIYFTMITLAMAQIVYFLCVQTPLTGGEDGMHGIPRPKFLGVVDLASDWAVYYLCLGVTLVAYLLSRRIVNSPFGQVVQAIRDNDDKARALGYRAESYILILFILSSAFSGLAGALKAVGLGHVTLSDAHWLLGGMVLLMVLVGGKGKLAGPLVGAIFITVIENRVGWVSNLIGDIGALEWLAKLTNSSTFLIGLVFIVFVLVFPDGLLGVKRGRNGKAVES